jgi:surface antigen
MKKVTCILLALSVFATGCTSAPSKQTTGAVVGGIAGGALGSQLGGGTGNKIAIVAGTLLGAALGGAIGGSMDKADETYAQSALESSLDNEPVQWVNPNTQNQYTVTPTKTYTSNGTPCREFSTTAVIDGQKETVYGTACRQSDGTWQTME